jgi:hypothetical protein
MGGMRKNMTVVYMLEWDNAKEEERFRKYMKLGEKAIPFYKKNCRKRVYSNIVFGLMIQNT